jgi:hypothetical protein
VWEWLRRLLGIGRTAGDSAGRTDAAGGAGGAGPAGPAGPAAAPGPGTRFPKWKGVSAFHLWWQGLEGEELAEVSVGFEVLREPTADRTYFWAVQATFADGRRSYGAAHLGLQWYPRFDDNRAANWGGYASPPDQGVFDGTPPALPGFADDPNTRAYPWRSGVVYEFRIRRGERGWAGEVTDSSTGERVVLRELLAGGDRLRDVVVWAEVFAPCESSTTDVRWTDFAAVTASGERRRPTRVRLSLPGDGNCPNNDVVVDDRGIRQITGAVRHVRDGMVLSVPGTADA